MRFSLITTVIFAGLIVPSPAYAEDPVLAWNSEVIKALKSESTPPLLVARTLAILHLSMANAVGDAGGDPEAIGAAYSAAVSLMPSHRGDFEKLRDAGLKGQQGEVPGPGYLAGCKAADTILQSRENDGSSMQVSYVPEFAVGKWRRTPPFGRPPELVQWASKVKPFVLKKPDQFRPAAPPVLDTPAYAAAFDEVREIGGKDSKLRTTEQAAIAKFWSDFSYTETPVGHWNSIARELVANRRLSIRESARLFAVLNVTMVDAGIACWDAKFHYNAWRPLTAIHEAAKDGNPGTEPDADWTPYLLTPAHPEYPSGHSVTSGAAAIVLAKMLGGDTVDFSIHSDAVPGADRKYTSLWKCAEECGESRIYGGIHFRYACEGGLELGRKVGEEVLKNWKK